MKNISWIPKVLGVILLPVLLVLVVLLNNPLSTTAATGTKSSPQVTPTPPASCYPAWRLVSAPATAVAVTVPSVDDAWAAGGNSIMHWNGTAWSFVSYPTPTVPPSYTSATDDFGAISSHGDSDVWVAGTTIQQPTSNGDQPAALLYFNGTTWQRVLVTQSEGEVPASPNGGYFLYHILTGVTATGPGEAWAVGYTASDQIQYDGPIVQHICINGGTCPNTQPTLTNPESTIFTAAASTGPNDVYVVGHDIGGGLVEHWNGTTWTALPHDAIGDIHAVAAQVPDEAWAAGATGILHFNGGSGDSVSAPSHNYTGIAIQGQSEIWAVSSNGIVYGDQSSFADVTSPSGATGIALDYGSGLDLWAAGPHLLHYPDQPFFTDVHSGNTFYSYVQALACRGLISGYNASPPCGTGTPCFLPGNNVTRGQLAKFISNAAYYNDNIPVTTQTFTDVPHASPFWLFVERVYAHGIVAGYTDPAICTTGVPCFLPGNLVTRQQTAKFVSNAAGYSDNIPSTTQTFTDVPNTNTFWLFIERAHFHDVIEGYTASPPCTTGTPCFLPGRNVSRGQVSKFMALAFFAALAKPSQH